MTEALTTLPETAPSRYTWLETSAVAARLGINEGNIRKRCAAEWIGQGLARQVDGGGKRRRWQVRSDADPRLAPSPIVPAETPAPISQTRDSIAPALLPGANHKLRLLNAWATHVAAFLTCHPDKTKNDATDDFLEYLAKTEGAGAKIPSRPTLYIWQRDLARGGLDELVDGRATKARLAQTNTDDPFLQDLKWRYLSKRQRKFAVCYDRARDKAEEMGWDYCSEATARRFIKSLKPAEVVYHREGKKAFTDKIEPQILCDYSGLDSNEIWDADHHEFDVLVKVGERLNTKTGEIEPQFSRPWLTAWQDLRSRKIVGHLIRVENPNTEAILIAFHRGCSSHGVPLGAHTDNGKDFVSRHFCGLTKAEHAALFRKRKVRVEHDQAQLGGIYAALGITHIRAWKYHGQSKPIEPWFGYMEERFGREWDTYCGRSPLHRPEDLKEHLRAGHAPTLDEFIYAFGIWLEAEFHQRHEHTGHAMDGQTPAVAWESHFLKQGRRLIEPAKLDILLAQRIGPLRVTQNGVQHQHLRWAGHGELVDHLGRDVFIRPCGGLLDRVTVWSADDRTCLGVVDVTGRVARGLQMDHLKAMIREKRADRRKIVASIEPRIRIHETPIERIERLRAGPELPALPVPPALPPASVETSFDAQLNAIQEAASAPDYRLAAGAESLSLQDIEAAFERNER